MYAQILGVLLVAVGGWLLWSPWSLIIAGAALVVAPEVSELTRRRQLTARRGER